MGRNSVPGTQVRVAAKGTIPNKSYHLKDPVLGINATIQKGYRCKHLSLLLLLMDPHWVNPINVKGNRAQMIKSLEVSLSGKGGGQSLEKGNEEPIYASRSASETC
jgi:hypothetical protein